MVVRAKGAAVQASVKKQQEKGPSSTPAPTWKRVGTEDSDAFLSTDSSPTESRTQRFSSCAFHDMTLPREFLVERLNWRVNRDDAFCSLPFSVVYMLIFIMIVSFRLDVTQRYKVEKGIEDWVEGYGVALAGPYMKDHVSNLAGMWDWCDASGLASLVGACVNASAGPECRMANHNLLLGDLQLQQVLENGDIITDWMLMSSEAKQVLALNSLDYLGAARARLRKLRGMYMHRQDVVEVSLIFRTFQNRVSMFTVSKAFAERSNNGPVNHVVRSTAMMVDPYPHWSAYVMDSLFVFFTLWPLLQELRQLVRMCYAMGCGEGFMSYWNFWNVVDWANVILGISVAVNWALCCMAMQAPGLGGLLQAGADGPELRKSLMTLDKGSLEAAEEGMEELQKLWGILHWFMAVNVLTIMLKFFKGFQANRRLKVVTDTFKRAAVDIFHFAIVFLAIFIGFSLAGHLLFGPDIEGWSSMPRSINTAWVVLMGDYEWYIEAMASFDFVPAVPRPIMTMWFWSYTYFVVLIILNMLLAIVLEHYQTTCAEVKAAQDAPPLWRQCLNYIRRKQETRGHIPLDHLLCLLVDGDNPVHEEPMVNRESLKENVPKMTEGQANWLMRFLVAEQKKLDHHHETDAGDVVQKLQAVEKLARKLAKQMHKLSLTTATGSQRLDRMQASLPHIEGFTLSRRSGGSASRDNSRAAAVNPDAVAAPGGLKVSSKAPQAEF
eukprot:TRINITY_DN27166_c0_g1_i1.p1 TRINITY_DN27166_c0_g1~~TRINITY_DN27166_c0_g1_i1.p1  ORF type:complete len:720 (-),score=149.24 TRINITY_DN27166_c0_g1_i1:30-2189(-)